MPGLEPRAFSAGPQAQPPAWVHIRLFGMDGSRLWAVHISLESSFSWPDNQSCPGSVAGQER